MMVVPIRQGAISKQAHGGDFVQGIFHGTVARLGTNAACSEYAAWSQRIGPPPRRLGIKRLDDSGQYSAMAESARMRERKIFKSDGT
jgi:hypothetical protein